MGRKLELSFELLCERYDACYRQQAAAIKALMKFDGVVGIGVGPKESAGRLLPEQPCYIVYVEQKLSGDVLEPAQRIPAEFGGIATDVVAIGSRIVAVHNEMDSRLIAASRAIGDGDNGSMVG